MGILESDQSWRWAAYGKHPVARDFFRVGPDFPLLVGLSNWVEKGYESLASRKGVIRGHSSWRFWARGSQKETLACGLIRDSSDSLGRPYPLLMMGTGLMNAWEEHWDLLPLAFERVWNQMEYVSAQRFTDFNKLEGEIQNMRPPLDHWSELSAKSIGLELAEANPDPADPDMEDLRRTATSLSEKSEFFVPIDQDPLRDQFRMICLFHFILKNEAGIIPSALFLGGTLESAYLAVFRRPLTVSDFVQLWSAPPNEVKENGTRIAG